MKVAAILPAAGRSSRFGDQFRKKPFVELDGRAIWLRAIEPFLNHPDVVQLIVVVSADDHECFIDKYRPNLAFSDIEVVIGGAERADSVLAGLSQVREKVDYVAIHDAARPFATKQLLTEVLAAAHGTGAAIPALSIKGTIKRVREGLIEGTVNREGLWEAQTPQIFRKELLLQAYSEREGMTATDEAQLIEAIGHSIQVVEGEVTNIKITTKEDLTIAKAFLSVLKNSAAPKSIHPFADENPGFLA